MEKGEALLQCKSIQYLDNSNTVHKMNENITFSYNENITFES